MDSQRSAYLAGLIDADGTITIIRRKKYIKDNGEPVYNYSAQLCIYNCNLQFIKSLQKDIGGKIRSNERLISTHKNWRLCYELAIEHKLATNLIKSIRSFLIIKREHANIIEKLSNIKDKYNAAQKIWNPELKIKNDLKLSILKDKINKLNIRGSKKKTKIINIENIPYNSNYLAGFCDADGSILITTAKKKGRQIQIRPKITFTNTNINIINWIKFHKGGSFYERKMIDKKWNTSYELTFLCKKACDLAQELQNILLLKYKQASLLLELRALSKKFSGGKLNHNKKLQIKIRNKKLKLKEKCNKLNKRGV